MADEKLRELGESELEAASGGAKTREEKIAFARENVAKFYGFVPEKIREKILETYETIGRDAAVKLIDKFAVSMPLIKGMADLLM